MCEYVDIRVISIATKTVLFSVERMIYNITIVANYIRRWNILCDRSKIENQTDMTPKTNSRDKHMVKLKNFYIFVYVNTES